MSELTSLIRNTEPATLRNIASDITRTNSHSVRIDSIAELQRHHNDQRTAGILRVQGTSDERSWSCIVKVIDLSTAPNDGVQWVHPENEESIYRSNLLSDLTVPFRPVRCHGVVNAGNGLECLWIEDLTSAPQPPWSIDQYLRAALHLGQFDGHQAITESELPGLDIPSYNFAHRWLGLAFDAEINAIKAGQGGESVARALSPAAISTLQHVSVTIPDFLSQAKRLPAALTHGDSHARNMFPLDDETVAIDWSGIAREPLGTGVGALIGSGLTWSLDEQEMVVDNLERIYSAYVEGLREVGWAGNVKDVRIGMFCQLGAYLLIIATFPLALSTPRIRDRREHYEARIGVRLEEAPARIAEVMPTLTEYLNELISLTVPASVKRTPNV